MCLHYSTIAEGACINLDQGFLRKGSWDSNIPLPVCRELQFQHYCGWFNYQGLYQKAEALYSKGDFEYALVFYHRGHKIRPELHQFTLGVQKAQEAINNCIGSECTSTPVQVTYDITGLSCF